MSHLRFSSGRFLSSLSVVRTRTVSDMFQDELKAELEALEQEELDDRLAGAERAPIHAPASPVGVTTGRERESPT